MDLEKDKISIVDLIIYSLVFVLLILRIFLGVDFTDESQYISQAFLPFMRGNFFVNDLFIQQCLYLFYQPFTGIYFSIFGTDGAFLFFRFIFAFQSLLSSWLIYRFAKDEFGNRVALYMGGSLISFIPFSIPSLSYNTIVFQIVPVITSYFLLFEKKTVILTAIMSFLSVFLVWTYPPMFLVIILILGFYQEWRLSRSRVIKFHFRLCFVFSALASILPIAIIYFSGFDNFLKSITFSSLFTSTSLIEKGSDLILSLIKPLQYLCGFLLLRYFLVKKLNSFIFLKDYRGDILYSCIVFYVLYFESETFGILGHKIVTIFFLSYFLMLITNFKFENRWKFLIVLLSGGLICAFFSSNGVINICLTLVAGTVPLINEGLRLKNGRELILPLFLASLMFSNFNFFYRESHLPDLSSQIRSGPFKGIYTTGERKKILLDIETDIHNINVIGPQKVFSAYFPVAYTFGRAIPETHMLYLHDSNLSNEQLGLVTENLDPSFILIFKHLNFKTTSKLWRIFCHHNNCREYIKRESYIIYSRI